MKGKRLTISSIGVLCATAFQFAPIAPTNVTVCGLLHSVMSRLSIVHGRQGSPLVCNITALDATQRNRIRFLATELRTRRTGISELPNGWTVQFSSDRSVIRNAAEFITLERLCCPFYDFTLRSEAGKGGISLALTGRKGAKTVARLELGIQGPVPAPDHPMQPSPLVCDTNRLSADDMHRLDALLKQIRESKQEAADLPDGYAIRLANKSELILAAADYMELVRACSPYFETTLRVGCENGQVWLEVTGRPDVKEKVKAEFKL